MILYLNVFHYINIVCASEIRERERESKSFSNGVDWPTEEDIVLL